MLCDVWSDAVNDVLAYGPVLEFRLAWMAPQHATTAVWATAAEALIKAEFDEHSILVMKAFPLEYEGLDAPEGCSRLRWFHISSICGDPLLQASLRS